MCVGNFLVQYVHLSVYFYFFSHVNVSEKKCDEVQVLMFMLQLYTVLCWFDIGGFECFCCCCYQIVYSAHFHTVKYSYATRLLQLPSNLI